MILYCIDEKTGNIYDAADTEYVSFIGGVQSTSLYYTKKRFILTDAENLQVSMNQNEIFTLLYIDTKNKKSISKLSDVVMNEFKYKDLADILPDGVASVSSFVSKGVKAVCDAKNMYIHCIYVLCKSDCPGTYIEEVAFTTLSDGVKKSLKIGGDFYAENDVLKVDLQNFGIEIPDAFIKAIYQTNVHEEATDYVVLNRKRKELLNEYKNLEYQKGNYNSLENSLKFFEWGDRLKLSEYWKVLNEFKEQLYEKDINKLLTDELAENLDSQTKATIIGIHCALETFIKYKNSILFETDYDEKYAHVGDAYRQLLPAFSDGDFDTKDKAYNEQFKDENGKLKETFVGFDISDDDHKVEPKGSAWEPASTLSSGSAGHTWTNIYDNSKVMFIAERNPVLASASMMWNRQDLMLKMRLLANFYATYFMPLHLDLIQCAVEDVVFPTAIKQVNWLYYKVVHNYDPTAITLTLTTDEETYYLNSNVVIDNYNYNQDDSSPAGVTSAYNYVPFNCTFFNGIGAIAEVKTNVQEIVDTYGIVPKSIRFIITHNVTNESGEEVPVNDCDIDGKIDEFYYNNNYDKTFKCLLRYPGKNMIQAVVTAFDGTTFVSSTDVNVRADLSKNIEVKRLATSAFTHPNWDSFDFDNVFDIDGRFLTNDNGDYVFETYAKYIRKIDKHATTYIGFNASVTLMMDDVDVEPDASKYEAQLHMNSGFGWRGRVLVRPYKSGNTTKWKVIFKGLSNVFLNSLPEMMTIQNLWNDAKKSNTKIKWAFVPQLQDLYDLKDKTASVNDILIIIPDYKASNGQIEETWTITNRCNSRKTTELLPLHNPLIFNNLEAGIYDITFKYRFGQDENTTVTRKLEHAFILK